MKKQNYLSLLLLQVCIVFSFTLHAQIEKHSKVKVYVSENQLHELALAGIDVREGNFEQGEYLICDYSESEILRIQELDLDYEILIEDVSKYYVERNQGLSTNPDDYKGIGEWEVPENFEFGSMSGHATYDEIVAHLNNMANLFPDLITVKESIGQSIEGRDLWMVKISDNPNTDEEEPEVLYTSLHHAREPAGVMTLLFYMYYMLENYDSDPLIQWVVDNSEMYFVPVVNPDGYVYNETNSPQGGGMWRKNRRDNGVPGCEGVDLNRNYSYNWGYNDIGSSPDPCSYEYRGDSAFSEPEIAAIRDLCESHEFKFALNYHTYGPWLLYPWAYTDTVCPDVAQYHDYSTLMTVDNQYYYIYYYANGDADDWMYGEQSTKNKIFSFTPELGGPNDGFWCAIDRIIPIALENMRMSILVVQFAGNYAQLKDISPALYEEKSGDIGFNITRLGLEEGGEFNVHLVPISGAISSVADSISFTNMEIMETQEGSFSFSLHSWAESGTPFQFVLSVDNGEYVMSSDTITKVYGESVVIFEDDCATFDNWLSPTWGITTSSYYSSPASITDSPDGNYQNNSISFAILNENISLPENAFAVANFRTKWEIEERNDHLRLQIKSNNGSWTSLEGNYTDIGNTALAQGDPVYTGLQTEWVLEEVNLQSYSGETVQFRFVFNTDPDTNEDGYYVDDFEIKIVDLATSIDEEFSGFHNAVSFSNPIPNPTKDHVKFRIFIPGSTSSEFNVYNSIGHKVHSTELEMGTHQISIDAKAWLPGVYFCILKTNRGTQITKLIKL